MAKLRNASVTPVSIAVTAKTNNTNDQGHHHCFEQNPEAVLTFEVDTDPSVDSINFVLWNLKDPLNPTIAEPAADWPVQNGQVTIVVGPDPVRDAMIVPLHLGPGPYCATLTASSSTAISAASKSTGTVVGNALYYYETKKCGLECKY